jgi:hypothetical protein
MGTMNSTTTQRKEQYDYYMGLSLKWAKKAEDCKYADLKKQQIAMSVYHWNNAQEYKD